MRENETAREKQTQSLGTGRAALSYETLVPIAGLVSAYCLSWVQRRAGAATLSFSPPPYTHILSQRPLLPSCLREGDKGKPTMQR